MILHSLEYPLLKCNAEGKGERTHSYWNRDEFLLIPRCIHPCQTYVLRIGCVLCADVCGRDASMCGRVRLFYCAQRLAEPSKCERLFIPEERRFDREYDAWEQRCRVRDVETAERVRRRGVASTGVAALRAATRNAVSACLQYRETETHQTS